MKNPILSPAIILALASFTSAQLLTAPFIAQLAVQPIDTSMAGIPQLNLTLQKDTVDPYLKSGTLGPIQILIDDTKPGITVHTDGLFGADLAVWNAPDRYADAKPYLQDAGFNWFRFPDGSLSNEYHWNGSGHYDSTGLWIVDSKNWTPGFVAECKWRGTSKDNYGFKRASNLTDGDTNTEWWGTLYDSQDPPWFMVDLGSAQTVDSMHIDWGKLRPKAYTLVAWDSNEAKYPGPHQNHTNLWKPLVAGKDGIVKKNFSTAHFAPRSARYWAVRFNTSDLNKEGVQVREFKLLGAGQAITHNVPDAHQQPKTLGIGTRSGDFARTDWTNIKWNFESFIDYVKNMPNGRAVIDVNLGLGTPEEAAAWVRYANKTKGYNIHDWQIGNENDGDWEEAGPLSARQYTAKFLAFARAMKAVDPTIHIHGPLHSGDEVNLRGDGTYSGKSWLNTFLKLVGEAERHDKKTYLDAVDFHTYPYWAKENLNAHAMLGASSRLGPNIDTLLNWMGTLLPEGNKRELHMSEFSSTVVGTDITLRAVQASAVAHIFGQFMVRAGDRGHVLPWDVYGGWQKGPDNTQGAIRLFNSPGEGAWSSWGHIAPSSQYFGLYLAFQNWVREGLHVLPATSLDSAIRVFALGNNDTTHLLFINMSAKDLPVQATRKSGTASPSETFFFSDRNFTWNGTDQRAFAQPGIGPWANRNASATQITFTIPAHGIALLNWDAKMLQKNPVEVMHAGITSNLLLPGDTFEYWATLRQREGSIVSGEFRCPPFASGKLMPVDSSFGGELEGVHIRVPIPKDAKPGNYELGLQAEGFGGEGIAEKYPFRVRGNYRTIYSIADFDGKEPNMYTYANGNNTTAINTEIKPGSMPLGGFLLAKFTIEQPKGQNWPNFASVHFPIERNMMEGNGIPGVPEGTRIAGIVFDYASMHSSEDGYFDVLIPSDNVKDYDEFKANLRNTHGTWLRDTVLWIKTSQDGWGKSQGTLQANNVKELEFRAHGEGKGEMRLDNISLLGEDGKEIPLPNAMRRLR